MLYSREATADRAPGPPLVYTKSGRFESALVAENVEVAAAAVGGGDDDDDDDNDNDDNVELAPVAEYVEVAPAAGGGGNNDDDDDDGDDDDDVESAPVAENVEVAAAAGRGRGDDDDDDDDDNGDDDDDGLVSRREYRKQKGKRIKLGSIKLVRGGGWCDNCNSATDGPV